MPRRKLRQRAPASASRPRGKAPSTETRAQRFPIVGLGASAGGLHAVEAFLRAVPKASGLAFVVVQHLDPDHESLMAELLGRQTSMPVQQAVDGTPVEPDQVYLIPPNTYLSIQHGELCIVAPEARRGRRMPIDFFLRSLAADQGDLAIGVVLSGTGSDGTLGLEAIKEAGGLTLVQSPDDAEHDGMPQAAIRSGWTDLVVPAHEMPAAILQYVHHPFFEPQRTAGPSAAAAGFLDRVRTTLHEELGHDFSGYKPGTMLRRIERRMGMHGMVSREDYLHRLAGNSTETAALQRDLLIGVTKFFRDPGAFEALAREALPLLCARADDRHPLRIWVPGVATGEEAYSLAMLVEEHLHESGRNDVRYQVFASDVDEEALERARKGLYPETIAADVTPERLARFFTREAEGYRVQPALREAVTFAAQNVIEDPPFSRIDLVSCRNLLIYLIPEVQQRVLQLIHFALRGGGFLFLGAAESPTGERTLFHPVDQKWRIYRRAAVAGRPVVHRPDTTGRHREAVTGAHTTSPSQRAERLAERVLIEHFSPCAVLIDRAQRALHFVGPTAGFLELPSGDPTTDLVALTARPLRPHLRSVLHRCVRDGSPDASTTFRVAGDRVRRLRVTVRRVEPAQGEALFLVVFEELEPPVAASCGDDRGVASAEHEHIVQQLEEELSRSRDDLHRSIAELESSNQELQASNEEVMSMNEELQSANEELETSKEELQTLNDELTTVNGQLQEKVLELENLTADLNNLLSSTDIATVFLDRDLRIRRFTPALADLMRMIPADVGRPMTDIARMADERLLADAREVLAGAAARECEVRTEDRCCYLRRVLPYRTEYGRVEGVVITYTDLTERVRAEETRARLAAIVETSSEAILSKDMDGTITTWNRAAERMYGYPAEQAVGRSIKMIIPEGRWHELSMIYEKLRRGERVEPFETVRVSRDGQLLDILLSISPILDREGRPIGASAIARDITAFKKISEQKRLSDDRLRLAVEGSPAFICQQDRELRYTWATNMPAPLSSSSVIGKRDEDLFAAADAHTLEDLKRSVIHGDSEARTFVTLQVGGVPREYDLRAEPMHTEEGEVIGVSCVAMDVTEIRQAERRIRESEERFRLMADSAPAMIWLTDERGHMSYVSRAWLAYTGESAASQHGRGWLEGVHPDDRPIVESSLDRAVADQKTLRLQLRLRDHRGHFRWLLTRASPRTDDAGTFLGLIGSTIDIDENVRLQKDLEEADRRKNDFLAILGHELRNPLASVAATVELLDMEAAAPSHLTAPIRRNIDLMRRLLADLLDIARITRGRIHLQREWIDLDTLLRHATDGQRRTASAKQIHLDLSLAEEPLHINADPARVEQIVVNVLVNALQHTSSGGSIRLCVEPDTDSVQIRITDDGEGIDPARIPALFDPFVQNRSSRGGGLGLGLTLVKQLAELHGGSVTVDSRGKETGTEVSIRLPIGSPPEQAREPVAPPARTGPGKIVLLVDDNEDLMEPLTHLLEQWGCQVETADSGETAIRRAAERHPDVVLLDVGLPDISGIEVARRLRTERKDGAMKIIAMSGFGEREIDAGQDGSPFDTYLVKPVDLDELARLLRP